MNGAEILAHLVARNLSGHAEHGRGAGIRSGQAGGGVVETDAWNHESHARLSRCARVAVGHVGRRLFVTGRDHTDTGFVPYRGHDSVYLYAWNAEYDFNPFSYERLHQGFAATHFGHYVPPTSSCLLDQEACAVVPLPCGHIETVYLRR